MPGKPKVSWKRLGIVVGVLLVLSGGFYLWQPYRVQWKDRRPENAPPVVPIEQVGLLEPGRRVLILVGHPDDDAYYIGGTLFRLKSVGANMRLVVCTKGDKGYYPFGDAASLAKVRREEEKRCSETVGIRWVVFLNRPDSRMAVDDGLVGEIAEQIESFKPDFILTFDTKYPYRVSHRDHLAAGEATLKGGAKAHFKGLFLLFATQGPNTAVDITDRWPDVEKLLAVHKSQFFGEKLTRIQNSVKAYKQEAGEVFGPALADSFRACRLKGP